MPSKWLVWALGAVLCVVTGCGNPSHSALSDAQEQEQAFGSLHLPLVTPEQQSFRLRDASFDITRRTETVVTLDSESDPGATSLDTDLLQGSYEITLRDGWRLERQGDAGADEIVPAALLTPNPLAFVVDNARVTELVYSFTTEQGVVTFGRGSASVSVAVTPTPLAACSVLDRSSCPNGQTCLFAGDSGQTYCAEPGSLPVGSPCSSEQCVAGAQCLSLDPTQPGVSSCARFCNPASRFCGCQGISADPGVGVCSESTPPGVLFSHDFVPGDSVLACADWNAFRSQLTSPTFARVTLSGSNGSFECEDPGAASQICRALRNDLFTNVSCAGHSWVVIDCSGGPELSVDGIACGCSSIGSSVRPCSGANFGGVGTNSCAQIPQTIEVICEAGQPICGNGVIEVPEVCDTNGTAVDVLPRGTPLDSACSANCQTILPPAAVCGNGILEPGEVCDTNGVAPDVLPPGTLAGSVCGATCTSILIADDFQSCLSCAQANCPTQFNAAVGSSSTPENTALVTQLFDCVIGPNWEAGGPIPGTSCFFEAPQLFPPKPAVPVIAQAVFARWVPCYCGSTPVATCATSGPFDNREACGRELEIASNCNPPVTSCMMNSAATPETPLGDALQLLNCERAACQAQCGFPPQLGDP